MTTFETFDDYVESHDLIETDVDRVWWALETPDTRALEAARQVAAAFPDLRIVATESRVQASDVKWQLGEVAGEPVVSMSFYPVRANHWTDEVIAGVREARADA